ncbi:helix-turn-helix domain-containing protein [Actinokineospora sp.]|uniref:helix-turn-helix domain-containing protein n=1 Tax=Actinokineospora sp. TaxID=1872133 RepID=UPI0040375F62
MIAAHLDAATLARVRLSLSPAVEALSLLALAVDGRRHPVFGDPGAAARFALRDPDVRLIAHTLPAHGVGYSPDLFTPQPAATRADRVWGTQLEAVAAGTAETVAHQIAATGTPNAQVLRAVEAGTFARRAAAGLARFWTMAMAEGWSSLRERLDADLALRARVMATEGVGALLGSLHASVRWTGTVLEVHKGYDEVVHYRGQDLVLAPSVLAWPRLLAQLCEPVDGVLSFPVRGLGGADPTRRGGVAQLLGSTRASLLHDLDVPRSTTDLSRRHRLAPATVSYHLSVLHGSGLVTKLRDRRSVLYSRTENGDVLR